MDIKDRKILAELTTNSRIPVNQLAKRVGVSKEVALYRMKRLTNEKTILEFYTLINTEALGYTRYGFFIQLKGITHEKEKELLNYLTNHPLVTYIGPIIGKWNLAFDILAKNKEQTQQIVKEITSKMGKYLETYIVTQVSFEPEIFALKLLGINKLTEHRESLSKFKVDETDLKVLRYLSTNSRIEYKTLASKIKLTANAIKHRIKNLEKSGIIQGYSISIDIRKLGLEWYNLQIKLNSLNRENELKEFLRKRPGVIYFYRQMGQENWDVDIGLAVKNSLELRDFTIDLKREFGDITKIHDIYAIVELSKGNIAPSGIFTFNRQTD